MNTITSLWTKDALDSALLTRFRALDEMTNSLSLMLVRVAEDCEPSETLGALSLLLRGPVRLTWHEDDYTLHHKSLGQSMVNLKPVGRDADGVYYEGRFPVALTI